MGPFLDLVLAYLERETIRTRSTRCKPQSRLARSVRRTLQPSGGLRESCSIKQRREREIVIGLRVAPADPDMRKTKAIICAELGDLTGARDVWTLLLRGSSGLCSSSGESRDLEGSVPRSTPPRANAVG